MKLWQFCSILCSWHNTLADSAMPTILSSFPPFNMHLLSCSLAVQNRLKPFYFFVNCFLHETGTYGNFPLYIRWSFLYQLYLVYVLCRNPNSNHIGSSQPLISSMGMSWHVGLAYGISNTMALYIYTCMFWTDLGQAGQVQWPVVLDK